MPTFGGGGEPESLTSGLNSYGSRIVFDEEDIRYNQSLSVIQRRRDKWGVWLHWVRDMRMSLSSFAS